MNTYSELRLQLNAIEYFEEIWDEGYNGGHPDNVRCKMGDDNSVTVCFDLLDISIQVLIWSNKIININLFTEICDMPVSIAGPRIDFWFNIMRQMREQEIREKKLEVEND